MTRAAPRRSPRRWPWAVAAALVFASLGAGLGYAASAGQLASLQLKLRGPALQLRRVEFVGLERLDARALWRRAELPADAPLIDIDPAQVAARIAEHPRVERCQVLRLPPGRLLIGVRERVPVAVEAETGHGVDEQGARFPLQPGEPERLPRLDGSVRRALPLLRAARELGVAIRSVRSRGARELDFEPWAGEIRVRVGADVRAGLRDWLRLDASGLVGVYGAREVDLRFAGSAVLRQLNHKGGEDGTS
ncbi:MAG: FtsQ-type POTRA domain-containing protein [Myxococcota bacterium]